MSKEKKGSKKMILRCDIPGAPNFVDYMVEKADGTISSSPRQDTAEAGHRIRNWNILEDDEQIGVYSAHDPEKGKEEYIRTYKGIVPKYVNTTIAEEDECKPSKDRRPLGLTELVWSNKRYDEDATGRSTFKETDWKRQDEHEEIPFP